MENLMALARHEQGNILQKLIYDDSDFIWWLKAQRTAPISWISPSLKVAFVSACDVSDAAFYNVAPADIKLEDYKSRMAWINRIAVQFHGLMNTHAAQMKTELETMAAWVGTPDSIRFPDESAAR
jgi:hypothetical protein